MRLVNDRFPDFELRTTEGVQPFELVEADRNDRRRGDEYKQRSRQPPQLFDPDAEERRALEEIRRVIEGKARKAYRPSPYLLVYVNLLIFGELPVPPEQLARDTQKWASSFAEIWLLWGAHVVRTAPTPLVLTAPDVALD